MSYRAEDFIRAIPKSGGIISTIASRVGCSWPTAKKWIDEKPTVRAAYDAECERVLDMAEGVIMKSIEQGETQDAKWYLTKKGKGRGYGDKVDVEHSGSIDVRQLSDDELRAIVEN